MIHLPARLAHGLTVPVDVTDRAAHLCLREHGARGDFCWPAFEVWMRDRIGLAACVGAALLARKRVLAGGGRMPEPMRTQYWQRTYTGGYAPVAITIYACEDVVRVDAGEGP
jgi:hypothetical protein